MNVRDNINISNFITLKSIIKNNAKSYKPKKAFVLKLVQIVKFMDEASDSIYLAMKVKIIYVFAFIISTPIHYISLQVILIFGICGCLRCDELTNMKVDDVEDLGDKYYQNIILPNKYYQKIKKYFLLRPVDQFSDRFFIHYQGGKCTRQNIERHKIGEVPEKIATYLQLPNPKRYTVHCFRRTSATLLSESGANMQMVKQLGRWRSDIIAQGYIENYIQNRQLIYDGVIQ